MPDLAVTDLKVTRTGRTVVESASFHVSEGEVLLLTGGNGSGKSSVLDALCGLCGEKYRRASFGDMDFRRRSIVDRYNLGFRRTFQENRPVTSVLVGDLVRTHHAYSENQHLIGHFWDTVGIPLGSSALGFHKLSFGQQKLVLNRLSLTSGGLLIMLDEPFAGLSAQNADRVAEWITAACENGAALIVVEHDVGPLGCYFEFEGSSPVSERLSGTAGKRRPGSNRR